MSNLEYQSTIHWANVFSFSSSFVIEPPTTRARNYSNLYFSGCSYSSNVICVQLNYLNQMNCQHYRMMYVQCIYSVFENPLKYFFFLFKINFYFVCKQHHCILTDYLFALTDQNTHHLECNHHRCSLMIPQRPD